MKIEAINVGVVFRTWLKGGGVIALFPYEPSDEAGYRCMSYEHVGQHGGADPLICRRPYTRPSTEAEARELKRELIGLGYRVITLKRVPANAIAVRRKRAEEQDRRHKTEDALRFASDLASDAAKSDGWMRPTFDRSDSTDLGEALSQMEAGWESTSHFAVLYSGPMAEMAMDEAKRIGVKGRCWVGLYEDMLTQFWETWETALVKEIGKKFKEHLKRKA